MAATLRNVGFEVVEGSNLTRDKMTERLLDFGKKAQGADVALFFYAGHGIAITGTNYLLPIDADIKSEMDVKLGAAINIDLTLEQTMGDAKVKLVFLDACRDNPFAAKIKSNSATRSVNVQTGLAEMKSGEGTLIAFATGPGQTALDGQEGTNSPFTRALLANLTQPGVEIQQAMTKVRAQVNEETNKGQLPWGHTNLIGSVYLNGAPAPGSRGGRRAGGGRFAPASDVELEFWRSIKESNKPEELNAYLTNYPNGQFTLAGACRASPRWRTVRRTRRHPQPDHRYRSRDLHGGSEPDHRGPDRPRQGPAPRRAAPPHRARLRHQGHRPVRSSDPRRDHALAGRPRLSQERLPQQAAAQGAADRDRRGRADREFRRGARPSAARASSGQAQSQPSRRRRSGTTTTAVPIRPAPAASSAASWAACCAKARRRSVNKKARDHPGPFSFVRFANRMRCDDRDLFARGLSQRLVDAVLPAGAALLEILQHVLVDAQRDQFPHAGKRGRLRRRFRHLGGGALERGLGLGARVVQGSRPSRLIRHR